MHNSYLRGGVGSGGWTNYAAVHGVFEQLDQYVFQSVNGDLGGTWAPAAEIIFGGSGLRVTSTLTIPNTGTLQMDFGANLIGSGWSVVGTTFDVEIVTQLNGPVIFGGYGATFGTTTSLQMNHDSLNANFYNDVTNFGDGTHTTAVNFNANASIVLNSGAAVVSAAPWFQSGFLTMQAPLTIEDTTLLFSGTGHMVSRVYVGPNSNANISIDNGDIIWRSALTASAAYTILAAGATEGCRMRIVKSTYDTFNLYVRREDASVIGDISGDGSAAGYYRKWVDICFIGGRWEAVGGQLM